MPHTFSILIKLVSLKTIKNEPAINIEIKITLENKI